MMDRKVDMALFSANNWINYQLEMQKAAIQIIGNAIEETRKAYKLQSKQSLDKDEGVEFSQAPTSQKSTSCSIAQNLKSSRSSLS